MKTHTNKSKQLSANLYTVAVCTVKKTPDSLLASCQQTCTTYTIAVCTVKKLLMMDRGTVRNMYSFNPKINLRN